MITLCRVSDKASDRIAWRMARQEGQALHALLTVLIFYLNWSDNAWKLLVLIMVSSCFCVVNHKLYRNLAALLCLRSLQTAWTGCLILLHVDRSFRWTFCFSFKIVQLHEWWFWCSGCSPTFLGLTCSLQMTLTLSTAYRLHPFSKVQGTFFEHGRFFQCILSGTSLSSALSSCGLGGEEDTEEEI